MDQSMNVQEMMHPAINTTLTQFDAELLSASIANNDNIIRSYHEKCDEIERLRADIQSITGSANQVRQMYESEKLQKDQLHRENLEIRTKLNELNVRLVAIQNEQINSETLYNQTVADFEFKIQKEKQQFFDLCRIVVDQGNILQSNHLSTSQLTRKCTLARETLESHGIICEKLKSPKKKPDPNRKKPKTIFTQTDPMPDPSTMFQSSIPTTISVETCEQSTQYQQSKATRSTCTSAFISFTDAFTTMDDQQSQNYFNPLPTANVMHEDNNNSNVMLRSPQLLPIAQDTVTKMAQSTQTKKLEYCTRETLTTINNVRKPIDYVRVDSPVGGLWSEKVKKEDISSALGSMSNLCWTCLANHSDTTRDIGSQLNPSLSHLWQLMGHVIFTMIDHRNSFGAGNQTTTPTTTTPTTAHQSSMQRMQHQLQTMIDEHVKGTTDMVPDVQMNVASNDAMDLDEHSRDSIESYNSGKIIISKVRDSSEVLSESQTDVIESDDHKIDDTPLNIIDDKKTRKVNEPGLESTKNLAENFRAQSPHRILVRNVASGSETIHPEQRIYKNRNNSSIVSAIPKIVETSNEIVPQSVKWSGNGNSVVNDFKVPKRKSTSAATISNTKKRKSTKSATSERELMTSIFGDDFDDDSPKNDVNEDDPQIRQIFDFFKMPSNIVSPIKDPERLMMDSIEEPTGHQSPTTTDLDSELNNVETATKRPKNLMTDLNMVPIGPMLPIKDNDQELVHVEILTKSPEHLIVTPMADLNDEQIVDLVIDLPEKPKDTAPIEKPTIDSIEEPVSVLNVNAASDSAERPNIVNSTSKPTAQQSTIDNNSIVQNHAEYVDRLPISPVPSDENKCISSPQTVDESTKCNNKLDIDYYSPASPQPEDYTETDCCIIPSETLCSNRILDESNDIKYDSFESEINQIIQNYSPKFAKTVASNSILTLTKPDSYLMASLRMAIERYCMSTEWTSETVSKCLNQMLLQTRHVKYLALALLEIVEDTQEKPSLEFTPPAPALPPSIQRCILLYSRLTQMIPNFSEYFAMLLERKMFVFKNELPVEALINLTHLYIGINDIQQSTNPSNMRLFIYKCLYYFNRKCIPLVFTVLMAHPFILPHANSMECLSDPLNKAIVCALTSIIYSMDNSDKLYKKTEMFLTLKSRFGYFSGKIFAIDAIIEYCIDCIQNNQLTNVDYAIVLLAKRQGYEYASKNIIQKYLIPLLHRYFTNDLTTNTEYDQQIRTILFCISSIVKTIAIDENIDDYVNLLAIALNATERQIIQEAAISGMCQLSRFGMTRIYHLISAWKPNYIKSKRITAILNTIVYRKPMNFWFSCSNVDVEHHL